jgi:hypothetical protein
MRSLLSLRRLLACSAPAAILVSACSSSGGGVTGGGPVTGTQDTHCSGVPPQATSQADCHLTGDGGTSGAMTPDYGPTMDNSAGDDDDCKYHVSWTSTPIGENRDVTFTVTATTLADGKPAGSSTGVGADANPIIEAYLTDTHPAPNTDQAATETTPGTYTIGPVRFDAPGKWTVRFHFYEVCSDIAGDSPHGHAAFFVLVP